MKLLIPVIAFSMFAGSMTHAEALPIAVEKYNDLQSNMNARTYEARFVSNIMGDESVVLVSQVANQAGEVVSENGESPSDEALESYNPALYFTPPEDEMAFLLPDDGYQLIATQGYLSRYSFQPVMNVKGKYHKDSEKMHGELVVDQSCACLVSLSMNNTDDFRRSGVKFQQLSTHWEFFTDDWRPKTFEVSFEGTAFFIDVVFTENASWQYPAL